MGLNMLCDYCQHAPDCGPLGCVFTTDGAAPEKLEDVYEQKRPAISLKPGPGPAPGPDIVLDPKKHDAGKPRYDLLPWECLDEIVMTLNHGAHKYGEESWKSLKYSESRYFAAAIRHLKAWKSGEKVDGESGLNHLAHAAINCIFLLWFDKIGNKPQ